ncbi:MAG: bifunctional folylpolyglutamate synthase/dihydrofolate synthase [Firmicutes bacterium]|nr:bifunctional folylpolyglutamate synthase/dihydrofolate synthase [Bacillota bacterium]
MTKATEGQTADRYRSALAIMGMKPGLTRMHRLLASLGQPERALRVIHVAGTNGKGSTCAMMASILSQAAWRTGLYTSPQLPGLAEAITVDGIGPDDDEQALLQETIASAVEADPELSADPPTDFERLTAAALLHFARRHVDVAVIEAGLGGLLDATNVVDPIVAVITNVGYDHMQLLGDSLVSIATHKAGIIKTGCTVVTGASGPALQVVRDAAKERAATVRELGRDFGVTVEESPVAGRARFTYWGVQMDLHGLTSSLLGPHQVRNAAIALATVEALRARGAAIGDVDIRKGMRVVHWAGRAEIIASRNPMVLIDGAHNKEGSQALAETLQWLGIQRAVLVSSVLADKDLESVLAAQVQTTAVAFATQANVARAADAGAIADAMRKVGMKDVRVVADVAHCLDAALHCARQMGDDAVVVVMGSLYLVAQARGYFS